MSNLTYRLPNAPSLIAQGDYTKRSLLESAITYGGESVSPAEYSSSTWLDRTLASVLLVPALPIIGLLILLVRLTSRGPGIYKQVRVGLNNTTFTMYKIRSMRSDAEARSGAVWSKPGDNRITPVGKVLRALHLDELPQLFNVLRGEMALVGPRPERPEITPKLAEQIPGYDNRHLIRPGITGLAQVNLPPDTDLNSVRRKLTLDLEYARTANLWLDLRLILSTMLKCLAIPSSVTIRLLGLRREVLLPEERAEVQQQVREAELAAQVRLDAESLLEITS